jgi:hypothetical protein
MGQSSQTISNPEGVASPFEPVDGLARPFARPSRVFGFAQIPFAVSQTAQVNPFRVVAILIRHPA